MRLAPGAQWGPYRLERELGRGGMAQVWRAIDARSNAPVAIKVLVGDRLRDPSMRARFTQEARMLERLRTPRVVRVLEAGCEGDVPYIVMELVEGETLERVLAREGPLSAERAVRVIEDVAEALDAAHALGFVHRDVKPSNVMVVREEGDIRARLLDFGVAKDDSLELTATRKTLGSPGYMAPEQIDSSRNATPRTDVWALGVTAYQCLTGVRPFDAESRVKTLGAIHVGKYARPSQVSCDVPEAFDAAIARALAVDPAQRPASAGELARDLRGVVGASLEEAPAPVERILGGCYRLGRAIARGSMSTIYEGTHVELDRPVAIKVLDPDVVKDARQRQRFKQEAQIAAKLAHPNIVHVIDVRVDDESAYIVLERLEGESLGARMSRMGPLDPAEVTAIGIQILAALEALHGSKIVHRNIEPQNIFLTQAGAKLVDFGIVKITNDVQLTTTGALLGTPAYAAPEQVKSERIDERTDLYALAAVMYHALSGQPPFVDEDAAALLYAIAQKPPRPLEAPENVRAVIERALAKDPAARFQSAKEMARSLA